MAVVCWQKTDRDTIRTGVTPTATFLCVGAWDSNSCPQNVTWWCFFLFHGSRDVREATRWASFLRPVISAGLDGTVHASDPSTSETDQGVSGHWWSAWAVEGEPPRPRNIKMIFQINQSPSSSDFIDQPARMPTSGTLEVVSPPVPTALAPGLPLPRTLVDAQHSTPISSGLNLAPLRTTLI